LKTIHTAIELGTSKLSVLIYRPTRDNKIEVLGLGNYTYPDTHRDNRENPDSLQQALVQAIGQAEKAAGQEVKRASLALANEYCGLIRNYKEIEPGKHISRRDIRRLRKLTEDYTLARPWEITDVFYGNFNVDGLSIVDPYGLYANTLGLESSLLCMDNDFIDKIKDQLSVLGISLSQVLSESASIGNAIVTQEEMESGVLLIDIGGHSTGITYFEDGRPLVLDSLPVGGKHISQDLQMGLNISFDQAEKLKRSCILGQGAYDNQKELDEQDPDPKIEKGPTEANLSTDFSNQIVMARVEEILLLAKAKAVSSGLLKDGCILILTGGGLAMLRGIKDYASGVLQMPVRIGAPDLIGLTSPVYTSLYSIAMASQTMAIKGFNIVENIKKYLKSISFN
jgi:cell division protein FtsA